MKKTLKLEKRGYDFWTDREEIKKSDLQNFRLCGFIKSEVPTKKARSVIFSLKSVQATMKTPRFKRKKLNDDIF